MAQKAIGKKSKSILIITPALRLQDGYRRFGIWSAHRKRIGESTKRSRKLPGLPFLSKGPEVLRTVEIRVPSCDDVVFTPLTLFFHVIDTYLWIRLIAFALHRA